MQMQMKLQVQYRWPMTDKYRSDSPIPYLSVEGELARQKWLKHYSQCEICKRNEPTCPEERALFDAYMQLRRRDRDREID